MGGLFLFSFLCVYHLTFMEYVLFSVSDGVKFVTQMVSRVYLPFRLCQRLANCHLAYDLCGAYNKI